MPVVIFPHGSLWDLFPCGVHSPASRASRKTLHGVRVFRCFAVGRNRPPVCGDRTYPDIFPDAGNTTVVLNYKDPDGDAIRKLLLVVSGSGHGTLSVLIPSLIKLQVL